MTVGIDLVHVVDPQALERARRLEFAIRQITSGVRRSQIVVMVQTQFRCSQPTAWRVLDMAFDLAGPTK